MNSENKKNILNTNPHEPVIPRQCIRLFPNPHIKLTTSELTLGLFFHRKQLMDLRVSS